MVLTVWLFLALLSVGEGTSEWEKGRDVHGGVIRRYSSVTVVTCTSRDGNLSIRLSGELSWRRATISVLPRLATLGALQRYIYHQIGPSGT